MRCCLNPGGKAGERRLRRGRKGGEGEGGGEGPGGTQGGDGEGVEPRGQRNLRLYYEVDIAICNKIHFREKKPCIAQ